MGGWFLLVNVLFPIPFILLVLLCFPLPESIRRIISKFVLKVSEKILFTSLIGTFSLYQLSTFLSIVLFSMSSWEVMKASERVHEHKNGLKEDFYRGMKWRSERNFWISLMSMVLWLVLYRVYKLSKDNLFLRGEVQSRDAKPKFQ